jgi:hypothetical protein
MREHGKAETVDQPAQQQQACSTCGHTSTDLTVLDTCSSKSYRPFLNTIQHIAQSRRQRQSILIKGETKPFAYLMANRAAMHRL